MPIDDLRFDKKPLINAKLLAGRGALMKPWIFALGFCLLTPVGSWADSRAFDEVPLDHWSVSAAQQLLRWVGYKGDISAPTKAPTRYGLAVATARAIDKFGYNPAPKDSIDGLAVRDTLAAMVFEYGEEILALSSSDSMAGHARAIEGYRIYKASLKNLTASEWYSHFQSGDWKSSIPKEQIRQGLESRVTPPPRLTNMPSILRTMARPPITPEQARIAREESLKNQWPQLPPGQ